MPDTGRGTTGPVNPSGSGPGRWNPESGQGTPTIQRITRRPKVHAS
ncbi:MULTISPECIES: hypothetical protein [Streptomyces]